MNPRLLMCGFRAEAQLIPDSLWLTDAWFSTIALQLPIDWRGRARVGDRRGIIGVEMALIRAVEADAILLQVLTA
jgi:hypothetical protein